MKKLIALATMTAALVLGSQIFAQVAPTNNPPPPPIDTNAPPVTPPPPIDTNAPPVCTNLPPVLDTNAPPPLGTNPPPVWSTNAPPPPPIDWTNTPPPAACTNAPPPQRIVGPGQNPGPQAPGDVRAVVQQFQQDRKALIGQLQNANATQRAAILGQLEQTRQQFAAQLGQLRQQAQDQAKQMFNANSPLTTRTQGATPPPPNPTGGPAR